jgi:hypothetical protein
VKRDEQIEIGKWIDETDEKGPVGAAQREFRMTLNMYAQSGEARDEAEAKALASVRARHPGFTPKRRLPPVPIGVNPGPSKWRIP